MSNSLTEGGDLERPADEHGEILRVPTPAAIELKTEILQASADKEGGQGNAARQRSSIESRTDLRLAATNEAMRADPTRSSATLAVERDTARRWADLDATDFGRIRSSNRREAALEAIAGHMRVSPEYADELKKRSPVIAESAKAINDERDRVEREVALPMIERNAAALTPNGTPEGLSEAEQRKLAKLDARSLSLLVPGSDERHLAAALVAENARVHAAYRDELQSVAPHLAREASVSLIEREALRAVERRSTALLPVAQDGLTPSEAREAVRSDLDSMAVIKDERARYQAAAAMGNSARTQSSYLSELQLQSPEVAKEVQATSIDGADRSFEQEDRKTAELLAMQLVRGERAAAWTQEQAGDQVREDLQQLRTADTKERAYAISDMAIASEQSKAYAEKLAREAPEVAREVDARRLRDAFERATAEQHRDRMSAAAHSGAVLSEAAALAAVASVRTHQTARVVEQLARSPETSTQQLRDAQQSLNAPPLEGRVTAPDDSHVAAQRSSAIKRPISEDELSRSLLTRFIVSHEKIGLLDRGATEFTFRNGDEQGRVAFVDAGKALSTSREDKATIRAMIEVATAKHWKEVTVSGSEDFKRNAWLEASLSGLQVRGYAPRDADKEMLAELQQRNKPTNVITALEQEHKRDQPREPGTSSDSPVVHRKHIDGDALTPHEKTVLDNSRAILDSKAFGEQFTQAALAELEAKLRGERVYVGEIVGHGRAPYQFNRDNDDSYYVTLKTRGGEQVIWGKGLAEALQERNPGEQIVLQNIGKRDVTVQERVRDAQGQVIGSRPKESQLNAWKCELLSRFSAKARTDFSSRSADRTPTFGVYDAKAPRMPAQPAGRPRTLDQQRNPEQQRNSRER